MVSPKIGPSFFGENYEKYVSELTTEGTIAGEKLTPEERKEGFKKKNNKIDFQNFLEKVLERIPQESKEKITEGGISRVNFDRYDRKISGDTVEKVFSSDSTDSTDSTLKTNNIGSTTIVPISQIISPDQFEPDTIIKEVVKETDPDKLAEEIVDHVELDNLINEIRNESTVDDVSGLIKANNNLLETNQLIEGFIKAYEKDQIEEEKRLFKERDKLKKERRKLSFKAPKLTGVNLKLPSVGSLPGGNILEGLAKFGLFSALAGLVQFIPQIIKFVETLPDRIEKFFTEDIPNFITEKFEEFKTFVSDFFNDRFGEVKQFFEDLYTKIDEFTGGRLTEFIDGIKGLGPMIVEKSQEFYKTIDDWTGGRISGAFDWIGTNVITPMGDFFKEKIDYVGTKAGELWTNFSSSFLNFFGDIKFELPELPDLGVTEALGLTPQIEGPDLTQDLVAIGGSTAANIAPVSGAKGMAVEGMDAAQVANQIPNMNVGGKSVQLGTGLSQGGTGEDVQKQISGLREGGAKGVQVLGTGNAEKDATLQQIVEQNKDLATFLPAVKSDTGSIDYKATAAAGSQQIQDNAAMREQQRQQSRMQAAGPGFAAPVFDLIASKEGNYNSVNRGEAGDSPGGAAKYFGKNLTDMSVDEVMNLQGQKKLFAAGKYQIVPTTMEDFVARGGVSRNDMFNEATQEKFPKYVVYTKRPEVGDYLNGKGSLEDALIGLSAEFASIGVPRDMQPGEYGSGYPKTFRPKGTTFYGGTSNAAHTTPESVASALKQVKGGGSQSPQPRTGPFSSALTGTLDAIDSGEMSHTTSGNRKSSVVSTSAAIPNRDSILVTSRMGMRTHPVTGQAKMHRGTDISAPSGTPLHAFTDGVITDRGHDAGYGNYIAWRDSFGSEHFYAHMREMFAKKGDSVKAGTIIGKSGGGSNDPGKGSSTGPHLHWEYGPVGDTGRNKDTLVDPLDKFDYMMPFGAKKIISKPENTSTPVPIISPELGKLKTTADGISKPSGRRSSDPSITTINMPATQVDGGTQSSGNSKQQGTSDTLYAPYVNPRNEDDFYHIHTRSLFNIVR